MHVSTINILERIADLNFYLQLWTETVAWKSLKYVCNSESDSCIASKVYNIAWQQFIKTLLNLYRVYIQKVSKNYL